MTSGISVGENSSLRSVCRVLSRRLQVPGWMVGYPETKYPKNGLFSGDS
jgi:hypothetical protein